MIAIRQVCIVSFLLLTACASRTSVSEAPTSFKTSSAGETSAKGSTKVDPPNLPAQLGKHQNKNFASATPHLPFGHLGAKGKGGKFIGSNAAETPPGSIVTTKGKAIVLTESAKKGVPPTENKKLASAASSSASKIGSWEISGAMAARSKGKGWNASLNWMQRGASRYQIRLSGPLGSGTIIVSRNGGVVTLRDGPKTASSSDASILLRQQTGISLPVNNLYYWARGIPAPGSVQSEKRDQAGRLIVLRQAGYTIDYPRYTSVGKAVLPSSVRLQGNGVFIKLVISRWRV